MSTWLHRFLSKASLLHSAKRFSSPVSDAVSQSTLRGKYFQKVAGFPFPQNYVASDSLESFAFCTKSSMFEDIFSMRASLRAKGDRLVVSTINFMSETT